MNPNNTQDKESLNIIRWHSIKQKDSPSSLKNHSCIIYNNMMLFFGGYDGMNNTNNLYSYHLKYHKWNLITTQGDIPKGRNGHTATLNESNKMYIIGGWLGSGVLASDDVYELDLKNYSWQRIILDRSIGASNMHSTNYYKGRLVIFRGGNGREYLNNLIGVNIEKKTCMELDTQGRSPSPRANHGSTIVGNSMFIFGGWNGQSRLDDLYSLNLDRLIWTSIETGGKIPEKRAGMTLVNYGNDVLILFGGSAVNTKYLSDIHFYDITYNIWFPPSEIQDEHACPSGRAGHTGVLYDRFLYVFGGGSVGNTNNTEMHILEIDPEPDHSKFKMDSQDNIIQVISSYNNNSSLSDAILVVEGRKIYTHRVILSLLSDFFKNLFKTHQEKDVIIIHIPNYKYKHINYILMYLYSGSIDLILEKDFSFMDLLEIVEISEVYGLTEIKDMTQIKLTKYIDMNNYHIAMEIAKKYKADTLLEFSTWFYRQNKEKIINNKLNIDND